MMYQVAVLTQSPCLEDVQSREARSGLQLRKALAKQEPLEVRVLGT